MKIEKLSKIIHKIRKALGYATKMQIVEGWKGEMIGTKYLIKEAKKTKVGEYVASGGFRYIRRKNFIRIEPDFSFRANHGRRK